MKVRRLTQHGAVLVFALLVMVVAAGILGGIAQLAVTQSLSGRTEWESAARRIRLENSRALARQYILSQMWRGSGQLPAATLSNSATGGLGGFAITNVEPALGYWFSRTQDGTDRINPFNLFERGGFQSAWAEGLLRTGTGDAATDSAPWGFQIRTRSPIVAGFAFVNQRPVSNNWLPVQRMNMLQTNDYAAGFSGLPRMPVSSITNTDLSPAAVTMSNLGFLRLPKAEANFGDIYQNVQGATPAPFGGNASVTIDLDIFDHGSPTDSAPRFYEVPARVDIGMDYNLAVTQLVLTNAAGSGNSFKTNPVQVVIPEINSNLTSVVLANDNTRAVYLYRKGSGSPTLTVSTTGGNRSFRIGMTLDCAANFSISGVLAVTGGVRTAASVIKTAGDLSFASENNPDWKYDAIADRMMWLEDQRGR